MKISLLIALTTMAWTGCANAGDTYQLTDFNGTVPILGLFGDPINTDFFTRDLSTDFKEYRHYQGMVHPSVDSPKVPVHAWFTNESESENAIVVSATNKRNDITQNYLIKVPAWGELEVEITDLLGSDDIYFLSMLPFNVDWDAPFAQAGKIVNSLTVSPPLEIIDKSTLLLDQCNYWNNQHSCKVTNANGPATGGSSVGYFVTSTEYFSTSNRTLLYLNVYYPTKRELHHETLFNTSCTGAVPIPADSFKTFSWNVSGRQIDWTSIGAVLKGWNVRGNGLCAAADDPDNFPCKVDVDGNGTLDVPAIWTIELSNVIVPDR